MDKWQENKHRRNCAICEDYKKLRDVKEHGASKFTHEWICAQLSRKYFLAEITIHRIIKGGPRE